MHDAVRHLTAALSGVRGILNLHPAFASVLVDFDPRRWTHVEVDALVRQAAESPAPEPPPRAPLEIPVEFGGDAGPDLADVAAYAGMPPERVVELFSAAEFLVYFVGFATCFPYLGGLPAELTAPRLPSPRKLVPAGSVAIAGTQAGVYPLPSPGGWRLIGRTPMRLFDPEAVPPPVLRMGDRIHFRPL